MSSSFSMHVVQWLRFLLLQSCFAADEVFPAAEWPLLCCWSATMSQCNWNDLYESRSWDARTATKTYCLKGPKLVADSIVIGDRFRATHTFHLHPPGTATDTLSISHNIKYTQMLAETENIGSPETASGIGHTSYQFHLTYLLHIRYNFCSSYSGLYTNSIRSIFRGTYTSLFSEWKRYFLSSVQQSRFQSFP
jgi:hypothetical protein